MNSFVIVFKVMDVFYVCVQARMHVWVCACI